MIHSHNDIEIEYYLKGCGIKRSAMQADYLLVTSVKKKKKEIKIKNWEKEQEEKYRLLKNQ